MPKPKRYEVKITLGKSMDGTVIRKSVYSTKSKADARKKAEQLRLEYEMELCIGGSGCITKKKFSDWALYALETYKKPYVKGNTYAGTYLAPVKNHLIPYFGKMYVDEIRPVHIQKYINQAAKVHAPETVKKDFNVMKLIFDTAVDNQVCSKSPINLPQTAVFHNARVGQRPALRCNDCIVNLPETMQGRTQ